MKITMRNQQGEKLKETLLPKKIFEVEPNNDLIHQVIVSQMSNRRKSIAHTKDRSEVRGGGRKPWRQKGLGKARHGSIRSPIWIGGGVTFGPRKEKIFKKRIPNKMRKLALFMVLSAKAKNDSLIILDDLKIGEPKTKLIAEILDKIVPKKESSLIPSKARVKEADKASSLIPSKARVKEADKASSLIPSKARVKEADKASSLIPSKARVKEADKASSLIALPELNKNVILAAKNIPYIKTIQARDLNCLDIMSFKYLIMPKTSIEVIEKTFLKKE